MKTILTSPANSEDVTASLANIPVSPGRQFYWLSPCQRTGVMNAPVPRYGAKRVPTGLVPSSLKCPCQWSRSKPVTTFGWHLKRFFVFWAGGWAVAYESIFYYFNVVRKIFNFKWLQFPHYSTSSYFLCLVSMLTGTIFKNTDWFLCHLNWVFRNPVLILVSYGIDRFFSYLVG